MVKQEKAEKNGKAEKVGGVFRSGSRLANVYLFFKDEKWHTLSEAKGKIGKKGFDLAFYRCNRDGKKAGKFFLENSEDGAKARLVFGKVKASNSDGHKPKAAAKAHKKPAHKAAPKAAAQTKASVQDVPVSED